MFKYKASFFIKIVRLESSMKNKSRVQTHTTLGQFSMTLFALEEKFEVLSV